MTPLRLSNRLKPSGCYKKSAGSGHLGHSSSNNKPIIITFRLCVSFNNITPHPQKKFTPPMERRIPIRRPSRRKDTRHKIGVSHRASWRPRHDGASAPQVPEFHRGCEKNQRGVAISVTPRQIINQSLSHFFHNEKSHFCVLFVIITPQQQKRFRGYPIFFCN